LITLLEDGLSDQVEENLDDDDAFPLIWMQLPHPIHVH
jgi:hypothetical protein